jgi:hypothetical protein
MNGHKINNSEALKFIFAGKSLVTFLNTKTGNRFTFKVKQAKNSNLFFVSVLNGPESYAYIGTVTEGVYKHGKKSVITNQVQSVKVFEYVINKLKLNNLPDFVEVWHEGKCGKCGRTLTVPSSIASGLGPECIKSLSKADKRDKFLSLILGE